MTRRLEDANRHQHAGIVKRLRVGTECGAGRFHVFLGDAHIGGFGVVPQKCVTQERSFLLAGHRNGRGFGPLLNERSRQAQINTRVMISPKEGRPPIRGTREGVLRNQRAAG
ncbi:MAG: hypothetical protein JWP90_1407 [Mycetocola sp.]|jgi:hypothetical protein|nr:hypothetical protein [Mycetocola sp.]